jgi:uncharacterized protein
MAQGASAGGAARRGLSSPLAGLEPDWVEACNRQRDSLRHTAHRPFPLPGGPWVMGQTWEHLLFAHWRVEPELLAPLIPPPLVLDQHSGSAWVALTPFRVSTLHPRLLPPAPAASWFLETNVRTYVTDGRRPGILFFDLEATSRLSAWAARLLYRLPYRHAEGSIESAVPPISYLIRRPDGAAWCRAAYAATEPAGEPEPDSLEHFLVERYCLYTVSLGTLIRTDIHHPPWRIAVAEGAIESHGLLPASAGNGPPDLLHVAETQDVVSWAPRPLRRAA